MGKHPRKTLIRHNLIPLDLPLLQKLQPITPKIQTQQPSLKQNKQSIIIGLKRQHYHENIPTMPYRCLFVYS